MALKAFHANPSIGGFGGESTVVLRLHDPEKANDRASRRKQQEHLPEHGDAFCQIVKELVDNAVDACESLGPNQKVKIEIYPYDDPQYGTDENILQLKISDTGVGMDDIQKCVDAFRTSKDEGASHTAGRYGIGLTLCLLHAQRLIPHSCACITSATKDKQVFTRAFFVVDTKGDSVVCQKIEEIQKTNKDESGTCVSVLVPGGPTAESAWKRLTNYFTRFRLRSQVDCSGGPNIEVLAPTLSKQPIYIKSRSTTVSPLIDLEGSVETDKQQWEDSLEDFQDESSPRNTNKNGKRLSSSQQKLETQRRAVFTSAQLFLGCYIKLENVAHSVQKIRLEKDSSCGKSEPQLEVDVIVNPTKISQISSRGGQESCATLKLIRLVNDIPLLDGAEGCACGLVHGLPNKLVWGSFGLHVAQSDNVDKVSWTPKYDVRDSDQVAPFFQRQHGLWEESDDESNNDRNTSSTLDHPKRKHGLISRRSFPPAKARLGEIVVVVKMKATPSSLPLPTLSKGRLPLNHTKIETALQLGLRECLRSLQKTNPTLLLTPSQLRSAVREIQYIPTTAMAISRILSTPSDTKLQEKCLDYIKGWKSQQNDEEQQQNDISSGNELQESSLSTLIEQRIHLAITCKEKIIEETKRKRGRKEEKSCEAELEYSDLDGSDTSSNGMVRVKPSGTHDSDSISSLDDSDPTIASKKKNDPGETTQDDDDDDEWW